MDVKIFYLADTLRNLRLTDGCQHPLVHQIQQKLAQRGLYTGKIHGIWETETKDALQRFQNFEQLPAAGLDPITYCRLNKYDKLIKITPSVAARASSALKRANILITKTNRQLTIFNGNTPVKQFPIAIGKPSTPTPVGNFAIASKVTNPGGVLGTRWMGLNYDTYGIHGTNKPWLIGQMVSNGCIRMHNANAEETFALIAIGTPVFIRD